MDEWLVAVILIGISIMVATMLVAACRILGGWSYLYAWATGSKEERANLANQVEDFNGYSIYPPTLNNWKTEVHPPFTEPQTCLIEPMKPAPPSNPVIPKPIPPPPVETSRKFSLDIGRRSSIDATDLPEGFGGEGGTFSKLQRAMSCDSVCSDTSVVLETLDSPEENGELELQLEYFHDRDELVVVVGRAYRLPELTKSQEMDSYVKLCLLPDQTSFLQTQVQRRCAEPHYNERFVFVVKASELHAKTLKCLLFVRDRYQSGLVAEGQLKLLTIDLSAQYSTKLPIIAQRSKGIGELLFSLSYLPTAERLTVVLVKGRNLMWTDGKKSADPFVKVYLLQKGKKISKKKTSIKKGDSNPSFNEAMIFPVPSNSLQNIQLRLTVAEHESDGKAPAVGHIFVGPQCSGKQLSHWNQMISSPRKPIAMWHPLRK